MRFVLRILFFMTILFLPYSCDVPKDWGCFYNDSDVNIDVYFLYYSPSEGKWLYSGGAYVEPHQNYQMHSAFQDVHCVKDNPLRFEVYIVVDGEATLETSLTISYNEYKAKGFKLHYPADFPSGEDEGESADVPSEETE